MTSFLKQAYAHEQAFLDTLYPLVTHESPSHDPAACNALLNWLEPHLKHHSWHTERIDQSHNSVGDQLMARYSTNAEGPSTLLLCHYDTVWPVGTLQEMPLTRQDNVIWGPGTMDMKAGLAQAIHGPVLAAALDQPLIGNLGLLITSDEEIGSHFSRERIEAEARTYDRTFVLEPCREDGALKVGRKGSVSYNITFTGISAHAGNNPQEGASALREMAHFLLFAEALNNPEASVNLTVGHGGSVSNVIAETAHASLDCRVLTLAAFEQVHQALHSYVPHDTRVNVAIQGGINRPPLEPTPANTDLYNHAETLSHMLGLDPPVTRGMVGGGSDGNFTSAIGKPTLDGLGAVGQGLHARHEQIYVKETLERLALLTALLISS